MAIGGSRLAELIDVVQDGIILWVVHLEAGPLSLPGRVGRSAEILETGLLRLQVQLGGAQRQQRREECQRTKHRMAALSSFTNQRFLEKEDLDDGREEQSGTMQRCKGEPRYIYLGRAEGEGTHTRLRNYPKFSKPAH